MLIASETIHWPAGTAYTCKDDPAETVLKEYIEENIGPSAGLDENGLSRVRQWLTVEPDGAGGATWVGCRSDKNLLEVAQELAEYGPGDFKIVSTIDVEQARCIISHKGRSVSLRSYRSHSFNDDA